MLWPKNSFGVVTWPCAPRTPASAMSAKAARLNIQNLRILVGRGTTILRADRGRRWAGEDERAGFGDCHGVLEMRRERSVRRDNRPAVGERFRGRPAGVHHRFDGQREARHE